MAGRCWEVCGGKVEGGIVVRVGKDTKSAEHPDGRLQPRSIVAELELDGERLRYTLLKGKGPRDGWVSKSFKGRNLLIECGEEGSQAYKAAKKLEKIKNEDKTTKQPIWLCPQGTRGDCQPFIALGVALQNAGFRIRILASANFDRFVTSYGFDFTAQGVDVKKEIDTSTDEVNSSQGDDAKTLEMRKEYQEDPGKFGGERLDKMFSDPDRIAKDAVIIRDLLNEEKPIVVVTHGLNGPLRWIPWALHRIPIYEMEFCPSFGTESLEHLPAEKERLGKVIEEAIGVDIFKGCKPEDMVEWKKYNIFCACDRKIVDSFMQGIELQEEHVARIDRCVKGFLCLDSTEQAKDMSQFGGQEVLLKLQKFLDSGPKPIYVGWGSMPVPSAVLAKLLLMLKVGKWRAIICAGWGGHTLEGITKWIKDNIPEDQFGLKDFCSNPEHVCFVGVCNHEWLFQRCALTVHHGGAGTTSAALRAGVPTLITPFLVDQFAYAEWIDKLGVGTQLKLMAGPGEEDKFMDPVWSKTVRKCMTDATMKETAAKLGEELRNKDNVGALTKDIQKIVAEIMARGEDEEPRTLGM